MKIHITHIFCNIIALFSCLKTVHSFISIFSLVSTEPQVADGKDALLIMSKEISPPYVTHRSGMSWVQKGFYIYREYYVHTHRAAREYGHLNFVIWILWLHFAKNIIFFKKCLDQGIFPIQSTFRVHTYGSISIHKESCRVLCMYIAKERWILDY